MHVLGPRGPRSDTSVKRVRGYRVIGLWGLGSAFEFRVIGIYIYIYMGSDLQYFYVLG